MPASLNCASPVCGGLCVPAARAGARGGPTCQGLPVSSWTSKPKVCVCGGGGGGDLHLCVFVCLQGLN